MKDGGAVAKGNVRSDAAANGGTLVDSTGSPAVVACGGTTCTQAGDPKSWDVASAVSTAALADNSYTEFKKRVGNKYTAQAFSGGALTPGTAASDGVIYWLASGSVTLPTQNLGTGKVVLLADGSVTITGNLTFAAGGSLAVLSGGDISVSAAVTNLQGIYLAQGTFDTGSSATPLTVDGSVAGLTNVTLSRTATGVTPAELFIYHPEYVTNLASGLQRRVQNKSEQQP